MCACNPNILEVDGRGFWVEGQPGLHNESSSILQHLVVLETERRASYVLDNVCTPARVLSLPTLVFDTSLAKLSREALNFAILLSQPSQKADIDLYHQA